MEDAAARLSARGAAWSTRELELLVQAWEAAVAELRPASDGADDVSASIYHHFQGQQGGRPTRKPRAVAAKCVALRSSFLLVEGFDVHQRQVGGRLFFELHYLQKQEVMRSWRSRNAAVLELSAKMYAGLTRVFKVYKENAAMMRQLDSPDVADAAKHAKHAKPAKPKRGASDDKPSSKAASKPGDKAASKAASKSVAKVASKAVSKPDAKVASKAASKPDDEAIVVRMRSAPPLPSSLGKSPVPSEAADGGEAEGTSQRTQDRVDSPGESVKATTENKRTATQQQRGSSQGDRSDATPALKKQDPTAAARSSKPVAGNVDKNELEEKPKAPQQPKIVQPTSEKKSPLANGGRRQWTDEELELSVKAWEIAVMKMLQKPEKLSTPLPDEVLREFGKLQGGQPTRNRSALMSKRSALKFSSMHINEYNDQQERKGGARFSALPASKRAAIMKSWQNANALDISESMLVDVTRIKALEKRMRENDKRLREEARNNAAEEDDSDRDAANAEEAPATPKIPVWSREESWDLVRACAEAADSAADGSQLSTSDREARIFELFSAARAKSAKDGDASVHTRSLKELGRQWQIILASFNYIKAYNDGLRDEAPWFDLTLIQKRAYERCTVPPRKFVDLDTEMYALIQRTSFPLSPEAPSSDSLIADPLSIKSADMKSGGEPGGNSNEGDIKRKKVPRVDKDVLRKDKAEVSSVVPYAGSKPLKNNAWTDGEVASLLKAWKYATQFEDAMNITALSKYAYKRFSALEGGSIRRSAPAMRAKMNSIKNLYARIKEYDTTRQRANQPVWIDQPEDERIELLRVWRSGAHLELTKDIFMKVVDLMERPDKASKPSPSSKAAGKRKAEKAGSDSDADDDAEEEDEDEEEADDAVKNLVGPHAALAAPPAASKIQAAPVSAKRKRSDTKPSPPTKMKPRAKQSGVATGKGDRPVANTANKLKKQMAKGHGWTKRELLLLARACSGLLSNRPTGQYLSEEQKQALFDRYRELGGTRPLQAAVTRARNMIDSYDFIRSFDKNAASNQWPRWFELDVSERRTIMASVCNVHTNLNGLADMDDDLLGFISRMDAAARPKHQDGDVAAKPKKPMAKKMRKRALSGSSPQEDRVVKARYGNPEDAAAIARDILRRKHRQGLPLAARTGAAKARRMHDDELSNDSSSRRSQMSADSDGDSDSDDRRLQASDDEEYSSSSSLSRAPRSKRQRAYASSRRENVAELPPSSEFIVTLIQKQNAQFEGLLERFRRDRANDRKQFFDSIYTAIQARLPADNGGASHIERLVERQGRSLSEMLQRLQSSSARYPRAPDWTRDTDRSEQPGNWGRGAGGSWGRDQSHSSDWGRHRDWERDSAPSDWSRRREWGWSDGGEWERDRDAPWYGGRPVDHPPPGDVAPGRETDKNRESERDAGRYADRVVFPPDQSRW